MTVGDAVLPAQWDARSSGAALYASDVRLPGMLHARVLRSPIPSAQLRGVDVSAALVADGVRAIVTRDDLQDRLYHHLGGPLSDRHALAREEVRFIGEEVAAVAADSLAEAEAACRLIDLDLRRYRPSVTPAQARRRRARAIHTARPDNVSASVVRTYGDMAAARASTDVRVSGSFSYSRAAHAAMEPHSVVASWDGQRRRLDLWVSHQAPWFVRHEVADMLGLDIEQVHTHDVAVGGSFGVKAKVCEHEVLAAALSMKTDRPVRLVLDRFEEFSATKTRHAYVIASETGADASGRLLFRDLSMTVDNGAFNHNGPSVPGFSAILAGSLYRLRAARAGFELVYTNTEPGGSFRGYGNPQVTFALEQQVDEVAERLGMDPIDLRILNANRTGEVTLTGWRMESARLVECLVAAREAIGWDAKRPLGGSGRGVGVAAAIHVSGANAYEHAEESAAAIDLHADGTVRVRFAGSDAGTGQRTILGQIVAEELSLPVERVEVVTMESEGTPRDLGAWSSRGTFMSGHAVRVTAQELARRLRDLAATATGTSADSVVLVDGCAVTSAGSHRIEDLVADDPDAADGRVTVEGTYVTSAGKMDRGTGTGNFSETYSFAVQAVEVEVDPATGKVSVLRAVTVHDCGSVVNPITATSQVIGGLAMGLGAALGEELRYEQGRLINSRFANYSLPRASDLPQLSAVFVGGSDPKGPYGAKALGEICLVPTPAAVANAVAHAVGVRVRETPLTPEKVLGGLATTRRRHGVWRRPSLWWVALVRAAYPRGLLHLLDRWGTRWARTRVAGGDRLETVGSLQEGLAALSSGADVCALAGGTDLLPTQRDGVRGARLLIDIAQLSELRGVSTDSDGNLHIGAATTLSELSRQTAGSDWHVLSETIETIASPQIRHVATLAGNLCQEKRCPFYRNGFPCFKRGGTTCPCYAVTGDHRHFHAVIGGHRCQAVTPSDLATTLTALGANVTVASGSSVRRLPVAALYRGPGEPALRRDELITDVVVPAAAARRTNRFEKLQLTAGDFALVAVATSVTVSDGHLGDGRVVLGGVAPRPWRAARVERAILGLGVGSREVQRAASAWERDTHPLEHNAWKIAAASGLIARCLARS